jgi:TIR domain
VAGQPGDAEHGSIFVSYRRDDTRHLARRLYDPLAERFGGARIFMEVDSIEPGVDFRSAVDAALSSCSVLVALIGPDWAAAHDPAGRRRLDDPADFVVLEIATALRRGIRVVPVLVDGAAVPRLIDLPQALGPLAHRNAIRVDHETFKSDVDALLTAVGRMLNADQNRRQAPGTAPVGGHAGAERPGNATRWLNSAGAQRDDERHRGQPWRPGRGGLLGPTAQNQSGGRAAYDAFFGGLARVWAENLRVSGNTMTATVVFTQRDGEVIREAYQFVINVRDDRQVIESFSRA